MAIGHGELMYEYFPKELAHRDSKDKIRQEKHTKAVRGVTVERSKAGTKNKSHDAYHILIKQ